MFPISIEICGFEIKHMNFKFNFRILNKIKEFNKMFQMKFTNFKLKLKKNN